MSPTEGKVNNFFSRLISHGLLNLFSVLMPPSALARLTTLNFPSPWMFQLRNPENAAASTHAGVLEFIADEGVVFLPHWVRDHLLL
jgi:ubiquitin fusion degradation protein 1